MSAERFEKERGTSIGPGSYEIPTTLDEHAAFINRDVERFQEEPPPPPGGFPVFEDTPEVATAPTPAAKPRRTGRSFGASKENRLPRAASAADIGAKAPVKPGPPPEAEQQLRRRLAEEERLRVAEAAAAKKAAANARVQLVAKDKKVEELQKKVEELSAAHKEAQRKFVDLDSERGLRKKALYEREQTVAALQKSLSTAKAQLDERGKRLDELRGATADLEQLRKEAAALRDRLAEAACAEEEPSRNSSIVDECQAQAQQLADEEMLRVEDREALVQVHDRIGGLEQRFAVQTSEAKQGLRALAEAHNRLTLRARERLASAERRAAELLGALGEAGAREARLSVQLAVKQVTLAAVLRVQEQERAAEREASAAAAAAAAKLAAEEELAPRLEELRERLQQEAQARELLEAELQAARCAGDAEAAELRQQVQRLDAALTVAAAAHDRVAVELAAKVAEAARLAEERGELRHASAAAAAGRAAAEELRASELQELREEWQRKLESTEEAHGAEVRALEQEAQALRTEAEAAAALRVRAERAEEDLGGAERDCGALRLQNRELLATVLAFKRDLEATQAELRSAVEAEELLEGELAHDRDRRARLAGHANHKQKIQYLMNIKRENLALRSELKKLQQRATQTDAGRRNEVLVKASGELGGGAVASSVRAGLGTAEASRQQRKHEHALERVQLDYEHLRTLVERAALAQGCGGGSETLMEWLRGKAVVRADHSSEALVGVTTDSAAAPAVDVPAVAHLAVGEGDEDSAQRAPAEHSEGETD